MLLALKNEGAPQEKANERKKVQLDAARQRAIGGVCLLLAASKLVSVMQSLSALPRKERTAKKYVVVCC